MKRDYGSVGTIALRAGASLQVVSRSTEEQRKELNLAEHHQTYTRSVVAKLPKLSHRIVELAVKGTEESGYELNRKQVSNVEQYALTIQNVIDIYTHWRIPKYRNIYKDPYVIFVVNLKGGVSKTVSTVTLAHTLRVHQDSLRHDLRTLAIDLNPQVSSTMFLDHIHSIGTVLETAAQVILNDLSAETLREAVIRPTIIPGVDVIPVSIGDGFVASQWESLVIEHSPGLKPFEVLRKTTIDRIAGDYDFVFIDTGPHLDPFPLNGLVVNDLLLTPTPPAQVDPHSTFKYLTRLSRMLGRLEEEGVEPRLSVSIGLMSEMISKCDHEASHSLVREIYASNVLDSSLPRLDRSEQCGESFDIIISANPVSYPGSAEALKKVYIETERPTKAVFDHIEHARGAFK